MKVGRLCSRTMPLFEMVPQLPVSVEAVTGAGAGDKQEDTFEMIFKNRWNMLDRKYCSQH